MTRILIRRDTTADWVAEDTVLAAGEPGYDLDTRVLKIGDGVTPWTGLVETADDDTEAAIEAIETALEGKADRGLQTRTTNATLTLDDAPIQLVDATAGNVSLTLPATTEPGHVFIIKKIDASANLVFPAVGATIDGIGGFSMGTRYTFVAVVSTDVANVWRLVGTNFWFTNPAFNVGASIADGANLALGTGTGTKFGTSTAQKLGFFNATPVVQRGATEELGAVLSNLGLRAAGSGYGITSSGQLWLSGPLLETPIARSTDSTLGAGVSVHLSTVDASAGTRTLTLPATTFAYRYRFQKIDSSANPVVIVGTINGAANYTLTSQYQWVEVIGTGVSGQWYVLDEGGPASPAAKTTTATLNANEKGTTLADATAGAFTITPPATTVPGIEFTVKKIDNTTNVVTIAGTFLNPSGNITNLKLYVPNQYHRFVTTGVSGTFRPLESNPVHAPVGTPTAGLPDGTIFMEY